MLVLSRKRRQKIIINGNIIVEILDSDGETVKLGVVAPNDIPIMRDELSGPCRKVMKESE